MGLRSPSGPMRGRSVKEFEEQLTNLKKENFNLKLRIYFLEEKMGTNFTLDKDNVVKKNIELQVMIYIIIIFLVYNIGNYFCEWPNHFFICTLHMKNKTFIGF